MNEIRMEKISTLYRAIDELLLDEIADAVFLDGPLSELAQRVIAEDIAHDPDARAYYENHLRL